MSSAKAYECTAPDEKRQRVAQPSKESPKTNTTPIPLKNSPVPLCFKDSKNTCPSIPNNNIPRQQDSSVSTEMGLKTSTTTNLSDKESPSEGLCSEASPKNKMKSKQRTRRKLSNPFPVKLHRMLSFVEKENLSHIVSWQPHGRAFKVHKPDEFITLIVPKFFHQTRFPSFQRQLNLYGFNRFSKGTDKGAYYHKFFLQGRESLALSMVRTTVKGKGKQRIVASKSEPDFYLFPPLDRNVSTEKQPLGSSTDSKPRAVEETSSLCQSLKQFHIEEKNICRPLSLQGPQIPSTVLSSTKTINQSPKNEQPCISGFESHKKNETHSDVSQCSSQLPCTYQTNPRSKTKQELLGQSVPFDFNNNENNSEEFSFDSLLDMLRKGP